MSDDGRPNEDSTSREISFTFPPYNVEGSVDVSTLDASMDVKVDGTQVGETVTGKIQDGLQLDIDNDDYTGKVQLYLKYGNEIWAYVVSKKAGADASTRNFKVITI